MHHNTIYTCLEKEACLYDPRNGVPTAHHHVELLLCKTVLRHCPLLKVTWMERCARTYWRNWIWEETDVSTRQDKKESCAWASQSPDFSPIENVQRTGTDSIREILISLGSWRWFSGSSGPRMNHHAVNRLNVSQLYRQTRAFQDGTKVGSFFCLNIFFIFKSLFKLVNAYRPLCLLKKNVMVINGGIKSILNH